MIRPKNIPAYKPASVDIENTIATKLVQLYEIDFPRSKGKLHLSRKKFIIQYIKALILCNNVTSNEIAKWLNNKVSVKSNERRIKRFYKEVKLDYLQIACILLCLLPKRGKLTICIDRTNWEFGDLSVNILAVTAHCKGVGVPLFFDLLDNNGGNSNTRQRKRIVNRILRLIPVGQIECVIGDREFVGFEWWQYLTKHKIPFFIRCKDNTKIIHNNKKRNAKDYAYAIRVRRFKDVEIEHTDSGNMLKCNVAIKRIAYKPKGDNYLIILTNMNPKDAINIYKKRWSIEVFFQSIKGRGFKLENTQLDSLEDIKKLFSLVSIAFGLCFHTGIWKDETQKSIPFKNHGYKECSFFRYGFDHLFILIRDRYMDSYNLIKFCELIVSRVIENAKFWREKKANILVKKSFVT